MNAKYIKAQRDKQDLIGLGRLICRLFEIIVLGEQSQGCEKRK